MDLSDKYLNQLQRAVDNVIDQYNNDRLETEDLSQECYLDILQNLKEFSPSNETFYSFCSKIAQTRVLEILKPELLKEKNKMTEIKQKKKRIK